MSSNHGQVGTCHPPCAGIPPCICKIQNLGIVFQAAVGLGMLQHKHLAALSPEKQHFRRQSSKMSTLQHQSLRQGRAGQGRAGQGRAGQGRAGQGRAQQVACMHEQVTLTQHTVHPGLEDVTNCSAAKLQVFSQGRGLHQMRDASPSPG